MKRTVVAALSLISMAAAPGQHAVKPDEKTVARLVGRWWQFSNKA